MTYAGNKIPNAPKKIFHIYVKSKQQKRTFKKYLRGKEVRIMEVNGKKSVLRKEWSTSSKKVPSRTVKKKFTSHLGSSGFNSLVEVKAGL